MTTLLCKLFLKWKYIPTTLIPIIFEQNRTKFVFMIVVNTLMTKACKYQDNLDRKWSREVWTRDWSSRQWKCAWSFWTCLCRSTMQISGDQYIRKHSNAILWPYKVHCFLLLTVDTVVFPNVSVAPHCLQCRQVYLCRLYRPLSVLLRHSRIEW